MTQESETVYWRALGTLIEYRTLRCTFSQIVDDFYLLGAVCDAMQLINTYSRRYTLDDTSYGVCLQMI